MILDEIVKVFISYRNISYYRDRGYDVFINQFVEVDIKDVCPNSITKVNAKCDICGFSVSISLQKYSKSCKKGGYYSCRKCSHAKSKRGFEEVSNSIRIAKNKKYDDITNKIEENGYLLCKKCNIKLKLDNFGKNKNGRYIAKCKKCRSDDFKNYYKKLDPGVKRQRKRNYYRNSITQNIWRSILKSYLFRKSDKKLNETIVLLKYSSSDLKKHLESKFNQYMNWDNYGSYWQVDHIIPVSLFVESTPIYIVNSLSNLRPLEKNYNLSRGNKIDNEGLQIFDNFKTYIKEKYINL